jgi:hypothetical protein
MGDEVKLNIAELRKTIPQQIAESLCSVQPINIDFKALMDDPLAQVLITRFAERLKGNKE